MEQCRHQYLYGTGSDVSAVWYVCYGHGLARIPASMATSITLLEPVIAALLAILLFGERLPPLGWPGVGLMVACLGIITVLARKLSFSQIQQRKENFQIAERKES